MNCEAIRHFGTSRGPSAESRTSHPISASSSRISSARAKSFAARASSRSAISASRLRSASAALVRLGERSRARRSSSISADGRRGARNLAPVRFPHQLEHLRQRPAAC